MPGFNYLIDPETRDYVLDAHGQLVVDATAKTPMLLALLDEFGAWWGDVTRGSDVAAILRGEPAVDAQAAIIAAIDRALAPLKGSGRIVSHTAKVTSTEPLTIHIEALDGSRKPIGFTFNPLG